MKTLLDQLGDNGINEMASKIGAKPEQAKSALEGIMPTMLGAMSKNSQSSEGASGLLGALDRDHDGSIFDDLAGFLGRDDHDDGGKIVNHVLGDKQSNVEENLAMKTGLGGDQISKLMKMAAPLLMGLLGKQKKSEESSKGGFDLGSFSGLLGGLANNADKSTGLDLGDIMDLVGGLGGKKKGGLGGLLGGLFGK